MTTVPDPLPLPFPLGVLISGRGSNLQAVIDAIADGRLRARIAVVISNRADAPGLQRADESIVVRGALTERGVKLVVLAGFMRLLGPAFCAAFPNAILNVHPSLLPAFPGVDAQHQAIDAGVAVSGATVHFVTPELDAGPIILQAAVPVHSGDTADTLSARILEQEHRILPEAIQLVLDGRCRVDGHRVVMR